jgi:succinate-acetate transporter protein
LILGFRFSRVDRGESGDMRAADEGGPPPLQPQAATRVVLRPIASPFALGFIGLAGASVTLAGLELGWVPSAETRQVGLIVVVFGPLLQAIACVFGFLGRDAVAATGMGTLAGGWACIGAVELFGGTGMSHALGTFLFAAATGVLLAAATAAQTKVVPGVIMLTTAIRWYLTATYQVSGGLGWKHAAGYAGLVLGSLALYGAFSLEIEDIKRETVLPTLRRGRGREVIRGDLALQVEKVANEAGVREQL